MKVNKSLRFNATLNVIKTLMSIIFPLITYPYVTRILGVENFGKINYAQAIVSYFALFASLGINSYAVREGAKKRKSKEDISIFSNEIFSINIITTLITYILLFIFCFSIPSFFEYKVLIFLLSFSIFFTTMGIDWVNVIYEDYLSITIRSAIVQIINLILIFLLINDNSDYYIYAFLLSISSMIICIWNFIYCRKYLKLKFTFKLNLKKHLKPLLIFFANNLAISFYCYSDTAMLGFMIGDESVGIYSVAVKVYTVVKTLLAAIYVVFIPRLSSYYDEKKNNEFDESINSLISILIILVFPLMLGIFIFSDFAVFLLAGNDFMMSSLTLKILSFALVFAIISGVFTNCINTTTKKENISLIATLIAASVNILLNIILLPNYHQNGAAFTTVIAEFLVLIICIVLNRKSLKYIFNRQFLLNLFHALIGCIEIFIIYIIIHSIINNTVIEFFVTVFLSCLLYFLTLIVLKNKYIMQIVNQLYIFLKRRKI